MSKLSRQRLHRCSWLSVIEQMMRRSTSESSGRYIDADETDLYQVLLEKRGKLTELYFCL
jgi:hypothetical protein